MKGINLLIVFILVLSLAACGTSSNTPTQTTAAPATSAAAAEQTTAAAAADQTTAAAEAATTTAAQQAATEATVETQPAAGEQRVVTLSLSNAGWPEEFWKECNDYKILQNEYGITLDYTFLNDEQFGVVLASGDLADIVCPRQRFLPAIIENNMALDIDAILDEHIPNLKLDTYAYANDLSRLLMGGAEHKLFFLAPMIGPENANMSDTMTRGYAMRWDLYKQLGYPEINSDDDFIDIMVQMHELFPQTPDGLPVYAMAGLDDFQWWHQRGSFSRDGKTGNFWTYNGYLYCASYEDMQLINGYTDLDSLHWVDMRFYNKLWNLGLLDPDSFTMTQAERNEKYKAMQYLACQVRETNLYNEMQKEDVNTDIGIVVIPSKNMVMGGNKQLPAGGMPTDTIFINANSSNWEAAAEVLNIYRDPEFLRMFWNGIKGVSWDYDADGKPFLTEKGIEDRVKFTPGTEAHRKETGITYAIWDWTPVSSTAIHPDGYFFEIAQEFEYRAKVLTPLYREMAQHWGVDAPSQYYSSLVKQGVTIDWTNDYAQTVAMGINEIPTDILRIMNNVNEITYRSIPVLVTARTQEEFDAAQAQYLAEIAAANENEAWEWCLKSYNDVKVLVDPIFAEAKAANDRKLAAKGQ